MKKKIIGAAVAVAAMAALLTVGGTMAWLTDDSKAATVIKTGNVDIEIVEMTREPAGSFEKTADGIVYKGQFMPGQTFSKIVTVKNRSVNSAYVRVKVSYQNKEKKELVYRPAMTPEVISSGLGVTGDSWELGSDGYYYYNQALKPGEETIPVMEAVRLPLAWKLEQTSAFHLVAIQAEAIQSDYTGETAKIAFGYTEMGNGIIGKANSLTASFTELAEEYNAASGKEKDEILVRIRELLGLKPDAGWGYINNNDRFRSAILNANGNWPTVAEEGLAEVLHMSEEESRKWHVNIYVIVKDNYKVIPYISKAVTASGGEQWKARYIQVDGVWYQPASAASATSETTETISKLYDVGWAGVSDQWKVLDFSGVVNQ